MDADPIRALADRVAASKLPTPSERRAVRLQAGITYREGAEALGVSPMTFYRWEKGLVEPRGGHAQQYRRLLDELREAIR